MEYMNEDERYAISIAPTRTCHAGILIFDDINSEIPFTGTTQVAD